MFGVHRQPHFISQLLAPLCNPFFQFSLFLLRLVQHEIEVGFADPPGNHVLIEPQHHLFQNLNPFLVFCQERSNASAGLSVRLRRCWSASRQWLPIGQGSLGALPDFVQDKVVKGVVLYPVLGTVVLAERPIGLTGINLLRVLGVGGADGQRLAALAALDKPGKQAGFPVLPGRWRDFSLSCTMAKLLLSINGSCRSSTTIQSCGFFSPMVPILKR